MQYTVVLTNDQGKYTAVVPLLPGCMAEGNSRIEALEGARAAIQRALQRTEITTITVEHPEGEDAPDPWLEKAGWFADDPSLEHLLEGIYAARDT